MTSLLSFYGREQKRAYFFNLQGNRKNQFSYWPQLSTRKGERGFFVIAENVEAALLPWYEEHYLKQLSPYCEKVEYMGSAPLFTVKGRVVKHALIFRCEGYGGKVPPDPEKY